MSELPQRPPAFPGSRSSGETLYLAPSGRRFTDAYELEHEYAIEASVDDFEAVIGKMVDHSRRVRGELSGTFGLPYGPTVDERLDVFPGPPGSPVVIFLHGGYWRAMSGEDFSFVAAGLVGNATLVVPNYSLCPVASMDEIVRQHRAAIAWTYRNIADFGGNPDRIAVVGHSAGAHGVAMVLLTQWVENYGLPTDIIKGACLISGIYDLRPLPYTSVQADLRLTADQVVRNSPILTPPATAPPILVTLGSEQTSEFIRQSADLHGAWTAAGLQSRYWLRDGVDHFNELDALAQPDSRLVSAIVGLCDAELPAQL